MMNDPNASLRDYENSVVVTMIPIGMMQVVIHEIVRVIAVRNRRVAAVGAVNVIGGVLLRGETRRAFVGMRSTDFDGVFVIVAVVRVMQMPGIKIVHMAVVPDGHMAAIRAVLMGVIGVRVFTGGAGNRQTCSHSEDGNECFVHGLIC